MIRRDMKRSCGILISAALALPLVTTPVAGLAQQTQENGALNEPIHPHDYCTPPQGGYECATTGYEEPMTEQDIIDSGIGEDKVVYHFGHDLLDAGIAAQANTESGVPTLAIPGGPEGGLSVFIDGRNVGKVFTQTQLNRGAVNAAFQQFYRQVMERKRGIGE